MQRSKLVIILSVVLAVALAVTLTLTLTLCGKKLEKVELKDPTCTEAGMEEHWKDVKDGKLYSDEKGKNEVSSEDLIIAKLPLTKVEKVPETCVADGMKEHYKCTKCGKLFLDANGETEVTKEELLIAKHGLKKIEEVPATTISEGVKEHWLCETCNKIYMDSEGKKEATVEDLKIDLIPKTAPTFAFNEGALSKTYDGKAFTLANDSYKTNSDGTLKIEYQDKYGSSVSEMKGAGTYSVKVTIAESDLYLPYEGEFEFVVNKFVLKEAVINRTFDYGNTSIYYVNLTKADLPDLFDEQLEIEVDVESVLPGTYNNCNISDVDYDLSNVTINLTVNKVTTIFAFNDGALSKTYDGKAFTITSDNYKTNSDGAITMRLLDNHGVELTEAPKYGGSYGVAVKIPSTDIYTAFEQKYDITIKELKLAKKDIVIKKPYTGKNKFTITFDQTVCSDVLDSFDIDVETADENAGVRAITSKSMYSKYLNSYDFSEINLQIEITKIMPDIKLRDGIELSKIYDGNPVYDIKASDIITNADNGTYVKWYNSQHQPLIAPPYNQGEYTVRIGTYVAQNYNGDFIVQEFTISPKKIPAQTIDLKVEYSGNNEFVSSIHQSKYGDLDDPFVYVKFSVPSGEIGSYSSDVVTYISDGTYSSAYMPLNNYDMSDVKFNVEITKIDLYNGGILEEPTQEYNGKTEFVFNLTHENSDLLYPGDTDGVTVTITTSSADPGYYESTSTDGHTASFTVDDDKYTMSYVCFVIEKLSADLKFNDNVSFDKVYDGKPITEAQISGTYTLSSYEETIIWKKGEETLIGDPVDAGTYTLVIKVDEKSVFLGGEISKEVVISKKELKVNEIKILDEALLNGKINIPAEKLCAGDKVQLTLKFPTTAEHGLKNYKVVSRKTYDALKQMNNLTNDILIGTLVGEDAGNYEIAFININVSPKIIKH